MKVVINKCYGGFGITDECLKLYNHLSGKSETYGAFLERDDPLLIQVIETIGVKNAGSEYANLKIIEIPDGKEYTIDEYDGSETIHVKVDDWG